MKFNEVQVGQTYVTKGLWAVQIEALTRYEMVSKGIGGRRYMRADDGNFVLGRCVNNLMEHMRNGDELQYSDYIEMVNFKQIVEPLQAYVDRYRD